MRAPTDQAPEIAGVPPGARGVGDPLAARHAVHLYESESGLYGAVTRFLGAAVTAGIPLVVIATPERRRAILEHLAGRDLEIALAAGRIEMLDAGATLSRLMVGDVPDPARFRAAIGSVIDAALAHGAEGGVRVYGEMVDVLARAGNVRGALLLEDLWCELQRSGRPVSLLCAYDLASFDKDGAAVAQVCAAHDHVQLTRDPSRRHELERAREIAARRAQQLLKITGAIAEAVTADQVYDAVVDQIAAALGASSGGLWLIDPGTEETDTRRARLVRSVGYPESARALDAISLEAPDAFPALDTLRTGEAMWIDSQAELVARYPRLAGIVTAGRSYRLGCLPLAIDGQILGSLGFTFDDAPPIDDEQRAFLLLAARYSAQALGRLRLLESERRSRASAERAATRLAILSRASRAFAEAGSDLPALLAGLTREVADDLADACAVTLIAPDRETLELAAIGHRDPDGEELVRTLLAGRSIRLGEGLNGGVAASGMPIVVRFDQEQLARSLPSVYHPWLERRGLDGAIVVPLRSRGEILGTLCAVRERGSPLFEADDLHFLQELAERAATSIERSRLTRESERARVRAELLYELAAAANAAERATTVYEAAFGALERAMGARRAAILAFDDAGVMRFEAHRGLSEQHLRAVDGHSPWSRDDRSPRTIFVSDAHHDPEMERYRSLLESESIAALGFIPLTASGVLVGKLMIYYDAPRGLGDHEIELANAIASHVAVALVRFRGVAALQESVRFNEMFTGMLGHDLRSPLAAIMTVAQLLQMRGEGNGPSKPVERILRSGGRMSRMIDQLLDFTRVRVGSGVPLTSRPVEITAVLRQVIDELEQAHPGCAITLEPPSGGLTDGHWDADRLAQVFSNLVGNAVQHGSSQAGVRVRVHALEGDRVQVDVHNHGAIPSALLPSVFEPMSGGTERRDGSRGLGLGLYITREIVRAHGGVIEVRSSEAEGTTFAIVLPREGSIRLAG